MAKKIAGVMLVNKNAEVGLVNARLFYSTLTSVVIIVLI